jgi:hypothetical protein
MNIITNEKPQIGGQIGFKDPQGDLYRLAEKAKDIVKQKGEYGMAATQFGIDRGRGGLSDASTAISTRASSAATFIGETGMKTATTISTHTPVGNMIKAGSKYNTFYKLLILVLFFTIFLKVIINIFRFFGIDIIDIYSYMGWIIFLLIILFFIPHDYSTLKLN